MAPVISLPKGGGAVRGIGEKFSALPATGTGSLSVPIAVSPGRAGFGPQLSLSYDSGTGNGAFGMGWNLSAPRITRKTEKGLPRYQDDADGDEEPDVFILSGAEDLVPALVRGERGGWVREEFARDGYRVRRYRPRVEGMFARIERWTSDEDGAVHWRSISRENVLTVYGRDANSQVADPNDPSRVFSWLICQSHDDKGNAIFYRYAAEDARGVDPASANERNRVRTANRYLERVFYGNRTPVLLDVTCPSRRAPHTACVKLDPADFMFEAVFDYGGEAFSHRPPDEEGRVFVDVGEGSGAERSWGVRRDPFSTYRSGFEVRTYRLCRRVLMFHRFPEELGTPRYLVRSTDLEYDESPAGSFVRSVTQAGYVRREDGRYLRRTLPPLELTYSRSPLEDGDAGDFPVETLDAAGLANLPAGLESARHRWVDLDGEGISGVLSEEGTGWFYKRNLGDGNFAPLEGVSSKPSLAALGAGRQQLLDLDGDGTLNLVDLGRGIGGYYERAADGRWGEFQGFDGLPVRRWDDPNLRFLDVTGDGIADVVITEDDALIWHPSMAKEGFGAGVRVHLPLDEERGARVVFADAEQSILLADMSGDGLSDVVRIRNGEVCYWPNTGYGTFGAKVTMDNAPWFDRPGLFDLRRIRLADTDGSGTTDLIYLGRDGVRVYLNRMGNGWSKARVLRQLPVTTDTSQVSVVDLLGHGTACLVWSSGLPADVARPVFYVDLMCGLKPHLLVGIDNNLGAETRIEYASSVEFYLADKAAGRPWVTRLAFPVHVVRRVETLDRIGRNRFVTRYKYHHGYFDGAEREFRNFGFVEQFDTEEMAALSESDAMPDAENVDAASHVPPVLTRTWFHNGAYLGGGRVSRQYEREYYREGRRACGESELEDGQVAAMTLPDTVLPDGLPTDELREACRSLKGAILRQEVYGLDGSEASARPYTVSERNYTIRRLQPRGRENRHAVFFTHGREVLDFNYERKLYNVGGGRRRADPRVAHAVTLEVDDYGNVLKSLAVAYGRRHGDADACLSAQDVRNQRTQRVTYTETRYTNAVQADEAYRGPAQCELRTYELLHVTPGCRESGLTNLFRFKELTDLVAQACDGAQDLMPDEPEGAGAAGSRPGRRLIGHSRSIYRSDDFSRPLPLGELQSLALPFEDYKLSLTDSLRGRVYGGRATRDMLREGGFVHAGDDDTTWWVGSGRVGLSPGLDDTAEEERAFARSHFFLPHRFRDAFGQSTVVRYDGHQLLVTETVDPLGNRVTAGERDAGGELGVDGNDYRVLKPRVIMDANRNRAAAAYDALCMVVATAVMGKPGERAGDTLEGLEADPPERTIQAHLREPDAAPAALLKGATTRLVYDLSAYVRTRGNARPQPATICKLARETHVSDLKPDETTKIRQELTYSDGFGREIQKKVPAEPGPIRPGTPDVARRWVGSGWTLFNNKGKPVRQYEPFFTASHRFEFARRQGVSATRVYDPVQRVVATLHPNHTYEKVVFEPWRQTAWDVNDTVLESDPGNDGDVGHLLRRLPPDEYLPSWHDRRSDGSLGAEEQAAARKASRHAKTPTVAHVDPLGRSIVTVAHNRTRRRGRVDVDEHLVTRVTLDIQGRQRILYDAMGRVVERYDYDVLGNRIHRSSMEAGERWSLNDATDRPLYAWDSRGHRFRTAYDPLRRPSASHLSEAGGPEVLVDRTTYGEEEADAEARNLRGRGFQVFDQAGVVTNEHYDFKGNPSRTRRRVARAYDKTLDWSATVALAADEYTSATRFDALGRPQEVTTPDNSIVRPTYNEANLLERVDVNLRGEDRGGTPVWTCFVRGMSYDCKGQRTEIEYGNGVRTAYAYDPLTFRLVRVVTRRDGRAFPGAGSNAPRGDGPGSRVQDLSYTYDPVGNITHVRDDAQETVFFRNRRVDPNSDFTYDAIYRLIGASGREHLGQAGAGAAPASFDDHLRAGILLSASDGRAMARYSEHYTYDAAGNLLELAHEGPDAANPGWRRVYAYDELSGLEPGRRNNRLTSTTVGSQVERYSTDGDGYDPHGNLVGMPHLPVMEWDFQDQLRMVRRGAVGEMDGGPGRGERTWYVYGVGGGRVRTVTESGNGDVREERIFLGGWEIYRRHGANPLVRETLHVMDDRQRIALVESRTSGEEAGVPARLTRYQLGDQLGSVTVELDDRAGLISYEEYTPYGATSFQAVQSETLPRKRFRHSGKERDEETGFYHLGARYYAPWLGRWTSADPAGVIDGLNLYSYAAANPVRYNDPTGTQCDPETTNCGDRNDPANYESFESFLRGAVGPWSPEALQSAWNARNPPGSTTSVTYPSDNVAFRRSGVARTPTGELSGTMVDPNIATEGFNARNPLSSTTPVEHATGRALTTVGDIVTHEEIRVSNSPWISASRNPNITSTQFSGELYVIDMNKLPEGTEVIENPQLLDMAREQLPPENPWFRNQTEGSVLGPAEQEVLIRNHVPPEAITPASELPRVTTPNPPAVLPTTGAAGWIGRNGTNVGRGLTAVAVVFTAIDLYHAAERSSDRGDWRPFAGEVVRQGFTWAGAYAGGYAGSAVGAFLGGGGGAVAGAPTGPGEVVTIPAGAVVGGFVGGIVGSIAGGAGGRWVGNKAVDYLGWN